MKKKKQEESDCLKKRYTKDWTKMDDEASFNEGEWESTGKKKKRAKT